MELNFNWNALSTGAPYVTINRISIAFNEAAISILKSPRRVLIGFDNEKKILGIKPATGEEDETSYYFTGRAVNGWVRIGCKDFSRYLSSVLDVDFEHAKRYLAEEHQGILIVDLTKGAVR